MATKPTNTYRWAQESGGTKHNIVEPSSGHKDEGWIPGRGAIAQFFNWLNNGAHEWILYLRDAVFVGEAGQPGATITGGSGAGGKGLVVTAGGTNENALETTGTGTGTGLVATGGATGRGITASAGGGNNTGITSTGAGTGAGVSGTGGGSNATGVVGIGGATNGYGVDGQGDGTGAGVRGIGGETGVGGAFTGGSSGAVGVTGTGTGTSAGGTFANGTAATGGTRQDALTLSNGDLDLSGVAEPTSTAAIANRVTPMNVPKAWGVINLTNADPFVPSVDAGFNVASVSRQANGYNVRVTFGAAMANANYLVSATFVGNAGAGTGYAMVPTTADGVGGISADGRATTYVDLLLVNAAGALVDLDNKAGIGASTVKIHVSVMGEQ